MTIVNRILLNLYYLIFCLSAVQNIKIKRHLMKLLLSLITFSLLLSACGPSKDEVLRMQMLEAQRIEAAAQAARQEAALREQRIIERRQLAYDTLQGKQSFSTQEIQKLYSSPEKTDPSKTYFFNIALQPEKYNYAYKKQNLTIIGMRRLTLASAFTQQMKQWQVDTALELSLLENSADNDELVSVIPNIKQYPLLENNNPNWTWDKSLFTDIAWNINPEEAWSVTANRNAYIQVGLKFCTADECIKRYTYKDKAILAAAAEVMSLLIVDDRDNKVLAEFIRPDQ